MHLPRPPLGPALTPHLPLPLQLSPNYVPSMESNKLSPLSPSYPTSDLGSSPRSSISISNSGLGPNWTAFRDFKKCGSEFDTESVCSQTGGLLTPGTALSPAPFSPFSDCLDPPETPWLGRSPAISPAPQRHSHFRQVQGRSGQLSSCSAIKRVQ